MRPIVPGAVGYARTMDARRLENRLAIAAGMWREAVEEPLPKLSPGDPEKQVDEFEMKLVDALGAQATPETAKGIAERTWDLVHDRRAVHVSGDRLDARRCGLRNGGHAVDPPPPRGAPPPRRSRSECVF